MKSIGWSAEIDGRPFSPTASDDGPWAVWIPRAWQALADPTGLHPVPPLPVRMGGPGFGNVRDGHADLLAWWGPFLHVTMFGLGWPRPDVGIERWLQLGRPTDDPILRLIDRWWASHVDDFLWWAQWSSSYAAAVSLVAQRLGAEEPPKIGLNQRKARPTSNRSWFGPGQDEMHITGHLDPSDNCQRLDWTVTTATTPNTKPRATLLTETYSGWAVALSQLKLPMTDFASSWRVDVVCKPLGWLGEYRLSRKSGRWFRGQHRWHQLGI